MRMYDIIKKKRDGEVLTANEISWFIKEYTAGNIPDYQASALCMAIYFKGMTAEETLNLTLAMRDSGERLDFSNIKGIRVDKHSTGGVGDKTSLIVAPIVATYGVKVAKVSGRGLGHTGGTVDKLMSIDGYRVDLSPTEFEKVVNEIGVSIIGQSKNVAPADKLLYALRDVTATVDSMPLIASSIMSKKLAADDDCIVLDVKTGSGAFMKTLESSKELARLMIEIGRGAGKQMCALITNMDIPLGNAIGNSLEVIEAIDILNGNGPKDLKEICIALSAHMMCLAGLGTYVQCAEKAKIAIKNGAALKTLANMVEAQGGNEAWIYDTSLFPKASFSKQVTAKYDGYISKTDTEGYGKASLALGAGREKTDDKINYSAGIILRAKVGERVTKGDVIATLFTDDESSLITAESIIHSATEYSSQKPDILPMVIDVIK